MQHNEPLVLVVEDKDKPRNVRLEMFEAHGFAAIGVASQRDAHRELRACPSIDLLVTDVNLNTRHPRDKSGVELARQIKELRPDLPMIAYSGRVQEGDLSKEDIKLFRSVHLKGSDQITVLKKRIKRWRSWATDYQKSRLKRVEIQLNKLVTKYRVDDYDFNLMREFIPALSSASVGSVKSIEDVLNGAGYKLKIVESKESSSLIDSADFSIKSPIPIWLRTLDDHVVAEVYQFPDLYASAPTDREAIRLLLSLMVGYYHDLKDSDNRSMAETVRRMRQYLKTVIE